MFTLKKEFADAVISVRNYNIQITKDNVRDPFIQKIISEKKGIHNMFEKAEPKAVLSRGADKNES
jgi:hypothetical protein